MMSAELVDWYLSLGFWTMLQGEFLITAVRIRVEKGIQFGVLVIVPPDYRPGALLI